MASILSWTNRRRSLSLAVLGAVSATWLLAHEGHQPLSGRGVTVHATPPGLTLGPEVEEALGLEMTEVVRGALAQRLRASAQVVAAWDGRAYGTTRIGGRVSAVLTRPGQAVTDGQPLAEVDSLELETLQLAWRSAAQDLRLATENRKRLEAAVREGAVSAQSLAEARNREREHTNAILLAGHKLRLLGLSGDEIERLRDTSATPVRSLPVRSPVAGVVRHVDVRPGQVVEPTQHLFEIVDPSKAVLEVEVLGRDWARVAPGMMVDYYRPRGEPALRLVLEGRSGALHPESGAGALWGRVPPAANLVVGEVGEANVEISAGRELPVIPTAAIVHAGIEATVFVQMGPRQYERKAVVLGQAVAGWVELVGGEVYPGDRVVTTGSHELASFLPATVLRPSPEALRQHGVRVGSVGRQRIAAVADLPAAVELPTQARAAVAARLGGTIERLRVERDAVVRKGDVLAEMTGLELHDLQLDLLRSHLQLELLEQTLRPLRALAAEGNPGVSARQLRDLETSAQSARLRRDSLTARLRTVGLAEAQVRDLVERQEVARSVALRAPMDGHVVRFTAAPGQVVKAEEALFEVHAAGRAEVHAHAPASLSTVLRVGLQARVRLVGEDRVYRAVVARIDPAVEDGDLSVWLHVEDMLTSVPHGLAARAAVVLSESSAVLAVPREALAHEGPRWFAFVRDQSGRFERRAVLIGRMDDLNTEVLAGLNEGDEIATSGAATLLTAHANLK